MDRLEQAPHLPCRGGCVRQGISSAERPGPGRLTSAEALAAGAWRTALADGALADAGLALADAGQALADAGRPLAGGAHWRAGAGTGAGAGGRGVRALAVLESW